MGRGRWGRSDPGYAVAELAGAEVHRVLKPGGVFFWIPLSDRNASAASGQQGEPNRPQRRHGGLRVGISGGDITSNGQACFYAASDKRRILPPHAWNLEVIEHREHTHILQPCRSIYSE